MYRLEIALILLSLAALSRAMLAGQLYEFSPTNDPLNQLALLLIPGQSGSYLDDATTGARKYFHVTQSFFGLNTPDISLPITWNGTTQARDNLNATSPLWDTADQPAVYMVMKDTVKLTGRPFFSYPWDWRRDMNEHIPGLVSMISRAATTSLGAYKGKVQIVTHSAGGLILLATMNTNQAIIKTIHSVVYISVPFDGNPLTLYAMYGGIQLASNSDYLTPQRLFTMPNFYQFYPLNAAENQAFGNGFTNITTGKQIPVDMYDIDFWLKNKLGIMSIKTLNSTELQHLNNTLQAGRRFRSKLVFNTSLTYPLCAVIASKDYDTPFSAPVSNDWKTIFYANKALAPGDTIVTYDASVPPFMNCTVYQTIIKLTHSYIPQDIGTVQTALCDLGGLNSSLPGNRKGAAGTSSYYSAVVLIIALMLVVM